VKPDSVSRIKSWHRTGQDEQIFYSIGSAGNEKYVYISELSKAFEEFMTSSELNHDLFAKSMPHAKEAPCDYLTIGAILVYLGYELYDPRSLYRRAVP
jgi:hypothetical protein